MKWTKRAFILPLHLNLIIKIMKNNSKLLDIFCIILAQLFFTTQDMAIKFISGDYALHQVMLTRSIVAMLFTLLVFVPFDGGFKYLHTEQLGLHFL